MRDHPSVRIPLQYTPFYCSHFHVHNLQPYDHSAPFFQAELQLVQGNTENLSSMKNTSVYALAKSEKKNVNLCAQNVACPSQNAALKTSIVAAPVCQHQDYICCRPSGPMLDKSSTEGQSPMPVVFHQKAVQ